MRGREPPRPIKGAGAWLGGKPLNGPKKCSELVKETVWMYGRVFPSGSKYSLKADVSVAG